MRISVNADNREYSVQIGPGMIKEEGLFTGFRRAAVVTDETVAKLHLDTIMATLERAKVRAGSIILPPGEEIKSRDRLFDIYSGLMDNLIGRSDAVIAFGGGTVGDAAGFAAATYRRGVPLVHCPTTLLAQVDSSVGGKVAIDLPAGKNLAGAFWQPRLVVMDPEVLDTLEDKTFSDGMAEVIKYGCIRDAAFFRALEKTPSRRAGMENIESVLYTCCDLKRAVVEKDERDTGERMVLNFGHTLGHAYEKAGHYETWTHGQAVAAGMCLAARLGAALGVTPAGVPERVEALVSAFGLPTRIPCTQADYAAAVGLDKKGTGEQITLVLLEDLGRAVLHRMSKRELLGLLEGCAE